MLLRKAILDGIKKNYKKIRQNIMADFDNFMLIKSASADFGATSALIEPGRIKLSNSSAFF